MNTTVKKFVPVMLTPFFETGEVNYDMIPSLVDFYLGAGASGLFANCLSSEMFELNDGERIKLVKCTVNAAKGQVPVIATGTFGGSVDKQADFIKRIYDLGTQCVIVITSLMADANEPDEILNDRVFELINKTENIPIGFYECPVPYKRLLNADQLQQYALTGRVLYHKDTSLNITQVEQKIAAIEGSNLELYDAYMVHAVESLRAGSAGLSCIQGNYFPELVVWLCENYNNTALQQQIELVQYFFTSNMDVIHSVYPVAAKYFLQKRGLNIGQFTRRDVGLLNNETRNAIDNLYTQYTLLQQKLNIPVAFNH